MKGMIFLTGMSLIAEEARTFTIEGPLKSITFELFGKEWIISESVVMEWVVLVLLGVFFFVLGRNLKVVPTSRRQVIAEWIVTLFEGQVTGTMGPSYKKAYTPYIGGLFCFIAISCLM